jgi:hypothetical protein
MSLPTLHRFTVFLLATLWAGICLALPAPHDIEQAVAQGQLPQAERMLREVIAEKPRSARAHYELAQVLAREGRPAEALQAITSAREIDPSLQFAQSPEKFKTVAQAIEQEAHAARSPAPHRPATAAVQPARADAPAANAWLWPTLLSVGFALLALGLWRKLQTRPGLQPQPAGAGSYAPEAPRGFGAQYDPRGNAPGYGSAYPAPAPSSGSGVAGAVVGGLAGVAAGYALSRALDNRDHPTGTTTGLDNARPSDPMEEVGRVRMDPGADLGSFDAGSGGEDWGDSGGSDNDSW